MLNGLKGWISTVGKFPNCTCFDVKILQWANLSSNLVYENYSLAIRYVVEGCSCHEIGGHWWITSELCLFLFKIKNITWLWVSLIQNSMTCVIVCDGTADHTVAHCHPRLRNPSGPIVTHGLHVRRNCSNVSVCESERKHNHVYISIMFIDHKMWILENRNSSITLGAPHKAIQQRVQTF